MNQMNFSDMDMSVTIPSSVASIGSRVFKECSSNLSIYGKANTVAETYAKENSIKFMVQ